MKRQTPEAKRAAATLIHDISDYVENERIIVSKCCKIQSMEDLDALIAELEPKAVSAAETVAPEWAIPIMIQAIGELYYGDYTDKTDWGNFFKRSLAYLWPNVGKNGKTSKDISKLKSLIRLCYVVEILYSYRKIFIAIPNASFLFQKGHVSLPKALVPQIKRYGQLAAGKGRRFRVADTNTRLMLECPHEFFVGIKDVLDGKQPKDIEVFKDTFYSHIPGVENPECVKFWKEVFCRYYMFGAFTSRLNGSGNMCDVMTFREFAVMIDAKYAAQEITENSFWKKDWFLKQSSEDYGNLIVDRPILRISPRGEFATSPALLGDSLNQFVENQLLGYSGRYVQLGMPSSIFRDAFSEKFEDQCIDLFRHLGYEAGHVLENGCWTTQSGTVHLSVPGERLYGEIDVFAYDATHSRAFLAECKVLHDVRDSRSYRNLIFRLKNDQKKYKEKLRKKASWLAKAIQEHYHISVDPVMVLVTDIPLPVLDASEEDVSVTDVTSLKHFLEKLDSRNE